MSGAEAPGSPAIKEIDYKERVQNFEEAFNKIKAATGISDINNLVTIFIKNEEHNFSLFNYVNEQNNEIEKLEDQILQLKEEENKYKVENGQDVSQHKEILKDLESKLQYTDTMAEKYELKCQDLSRIIEALKRGMQSMVSKVEVYAHDHMEAPPRSFSQENLEESTEDAAVMTAQSSSAQLYSPPSITEINMVHYLGILENKALALLQQYNSLRSLMTGAQTDLETNKLPDVLSNPINALTGTLVSVLGSGPKVPMGSEHIHINPPKADDYRSDEEDDDNPNLYDEDDTRPFTREELKHRTLTKLQKKLGVTLSNVTAPVTEVKKGKGRK